MTRQVTSSALHTGELGKGARIFHDPVGREVAMVQAVGFIETGLGGRLALEACCCFGPLMYPWGLDKDRVSSVGP